MPGYTFTNFGYSLVAGGAGGLATPLNAGDTTLYVSTNDGAWMPSLFPFQVRLGPNAKGAEIAQCTARTGDTLTLVRAQENTTAQTWVVGTQVEVVVTAAVMAELVRVSRQYLYLPPGWDTAWKAAKAASGSAPAVVSAIGDSITAGAYASDMLSTSWFALVRSYLLTTLALPLGGDYYDMKYSAAANGIGMGPATPPITLSGTINVDWQLKYYGYGMTAGAAGATTLTPFVRCQPAYNVVGFDIIYLDYRSGATWTYNVDGGSNMTVNCTGNTTYGGAVLKKISITGLSAGIHVLNINTTAVAGAYDACCILGIVAHKQAANGLWFANHGVSGGGLVTGAQTYNALSDTNLMPPDKLAMHQGYQGTTAAPTSLRGFGFPAQPDLAFIGYGVNDVNNGVTATQFEDALRRLVQSLRYGGGHAGVSDACSILLLGMYTGDNLVQSATAVPSTDYTGTASPAIQEFYDAMRAVAEEYGCGYASIHALMGRTPATNGWTTGPTNIHPTDAGYAKIAGVLEAIL